MKLPPPPQVVDLELTNCCQLACRMCPHRIMQRPKGFMDLAIIRKVLSELGGHVQRAILHQLGEPLLHPEWREAIQVVANHGVRSSMSTNGLLLSEENIESIVQSPLGGITVCLDGAGDVYEKNRVGASYVEVRDKIESLIRRRREAGCGPKITLQVINIVAPKMVKAMRGRFAKQLDGIGGFYVKPCTEWPGTPISGLGLDALPEMPLRFRCVKPLTNATVQWNGDVSVCCRDYDGVAVMGNVTKQTFMEVWHGANYSKFRESLRERRFHEFCKDCTQ